MSKTEPNIDRQKRENCNQSHYNIGRMKTLVFFEYQRKYWNRHTSKQILSFLLLSLFVNIQRRRHHRSQGILYKYFRHNRIRILKNLLLFRIDNNGIDYQSVVERFEKIQEYSETFQTLQKYSENFQKYFETFQKYFE